MIVEPLCLFMFTFDQSQCLKKIMSLDIGSYTIKTQRRGTATRTFQELICATISVSLIRVMLLSDIFYCFLFKYQNQQSIAQSYTICLLIRLIITVMNKQLERDLLCSIQSLKAFQLHNVLSHFIILADAHVDKNIVKKGMSFQCEISVKNQSAKGYGRTQQESVSNATKGLLSILVGKNMDVDKITKSLKYKNQQQNLENKEALANHLIGHKDTSLILDDISMIQPNPRTDFLSDLNYDKKTKDKCTCDCIFYDMHQYHQNEVKHLQARVNLLTQQNMLLKKMLLCGSNHRQTDNSQKQNSSYQSNSVFNASDLKSRNL